jgi:hypothetical protein
MHIFKNAGTTIDWVLDRNFGEYAVKWDDNSKPGNIFTEAQFLEFVELHPDAKSISSHQMRFPIPKHEDYIFIPMVFLRHPLDRAFSIYNFSKREGRQTPYNEMAKSMDLKGFIKYNMDNKDLRQMKNSQTAWLSYDARHHDISTRYSAAANTLRNCPIVGVVDRLDESLIIAEEALRQQFPGIDLSYIRRNVSNEKSSNLSARLESRRAEIGQELWTKLENNNNHDLNLYKVANEQLDKRVSKIQDLRGKLEHLQHRCRLLEAGEKAKNIEPAQVQHARKSDGIFGAMKSYFSK